MSEPTDLDEYDDMAPCPTCWMPGPGDPVWFDDTVLTERSEPVYRAMARNLRSAPAPSGDLGSPS